MLILAAGIFEESVFSGFRSSKKVFMTTISCLLVAPDTPSFDMAYFRRPEVAQAF